MFVKKISDDDRSTVKGSGLSGGLDENTLMEGQYSFVTKYDTDGNKQ
jgi:hypothetical protein